MSKIFAYIEEGKLYIKKQGKRDYSLRDETILLDKMVDGKQYKSLLRSTNYDQINTIILEEQINYFDTQFTVIVYIKADKIMYYKASNNKYSKLVQVKRKVLKIGLSKKKLKFYIVAFIINPFELVCSDIVVSIGGSKDKTINLKKYKNASNLYRKSIVNIHHISFNINKELQHEGPINNTCKIKMLIQNSPTNYVLNKKDKKNKNVRNYYVPMKAIYKKQFALHIRRSVTGTIVFVKRKKENIEYKTKFRILESNSIATLLFIASRVYKLIDKRKVNLYFEKFASKAEEGAFEIFKLALLNCESKITL